MKGILIAGAAILGLTTMGAQVASTDAPAQMCDKSTKTLPVAQQSTCMEKGQTTVVAEQSTCPIAAQAVAKADKKDCCAGADKAKAIVAQAADEKSCCKEEAKAVAQVASKEAKECCKAEAKAVAQVKEECCTSTEAHPVAKGEDECCNAPGKLAKFKVWADGKYAFYGCEGSANKGRLALVAKGAMSVGPVQTVVGKVTIA